LIQTFPLLTLKNYERTYFENLIKNKKIMELISFVKEKNKKVELKLWF